MGQAPGEEQRLKMSRQSHVDNKQESQEKTETEVIPKLFWSMQASYQEQLNRLDLRDPYWVQQLFTYRQCTWHFKSDLLPTKANLNSGLEIGKESCWLWLEKAEERDQKMEKSPDVRL